MSVSRRLPFVFARGGTSRCVIIEDGELPVDQQERDHILLRVIGGPDAKQLDGLGGGTQNTSKVLIVKPADSPDHDIEYTFAQIVVGQPRVDYGGNCGNCLAAAAAYAVDAGYVEPVEPTTVVQLWNTNTRQSIRAEVQVKNRAAATTGEYAIDGVPGTGAPMKLWFLEPGGAVTGSLLPTGNPLDRFDLGGLAGLGEIDVTIVDAGNLVAFVRAADVGATGTESAADINDDPQLLARLEAIRGSVAVLLGFVENPADAATASPSLPKVAYLGADAPTEDERVRHVTARIMAGGKAHASYAITGGIATAIAVQCHGTVLSSPDVAPVVTLHHPAGTLQFEVDSDLTDAGVAVHGVAVLRTSRRIAEGTLTLA
jgi:2-methylaconitate cis-trans-isomerase PrpF